MTSGETRGCAISVVVVMSLAAGCGGSIAPEGLQEDPTAARSPGSVLYVGERSGGYAIVRVDAARKNLTALTGPMPAGFVPEVFHADDAQTRFVVEGQRGGYSMVVSGTRAGWTTIGSAAGPDHLSVTTTGPGLALVTLERVDAGFDGASLEVVSSDGTIVVSFSSESQRVVALGPDYALVAGDADQPALGALATLRVVGIDGVTRSILPSSVSPTEARAVTFADRALIADGGTCSWVATSESTPVLPPSFACDRLAGDLVVTGGEIDRIVQTGLEPIATFPQLPGRLVTSNGSFSVFVNVPQDDAQTLMLARASEALPSYTPGSVPHGDTLGAEWTRGVAGADRACALAGASQCPRDFTGECDGSIVDLVCDDGTTLSTRRFQRDGGEGDPAEFTFAPDASGVFYETAGALHFVDARDLSDETFASSYTFVIREGALPSPWGDPLD